MFMHLILTRIHTFGNTTIFVHEIQELDLQEFQEAILLPIMYNTFIACRLRLSLIRMCVSDYITIWRVAYK
jgi:hypothetical protein